MKLYIFDDENLVSVSLDVGETKIILPSTITKIDAHSFEGLSNLEEIEIPPSVNYINISAFKNCYNLKKNIYPILLKN